MKNIHNLNETLIKSAMDYQHYYHTVLNLGIEFDENGTETLILLKYRDSIPAPDVIGPVKFVLLLTHKLVAYAKMALTLTLWAIKRSMKKIPNKFP